MKSKLSLVTCLFIVLALCALSGCGDVDDEATNNGNANAAASPASGQANTAASPAGRNANAGASPASSGGTKATGTLTANPNPVPVCGSAAAGKTTIAWSQKGATHIQVRVESPDGGLLADSTEPQGQSVTGEWVLDGTKFFLQDISSGRPETITTLTVKTTKEGCR